MDNIVHLLWFVKEMPEGHEDIELLIGVYSSEPEARAAVERVKDRRGFADFPQGFQIHPYQLNRDHWTEGFIVESC
ncbi:MAG: hypothetical protein JO065_00250 [Acidobacteria bacterium]|nr:hypothetical protein [Acidobacteriota bacterium]